MWSGSPSSSAAPETAGRPVRRAHALLLVGAEEATARAAREEVRRALCERGEGCGRCASCRWTESGAHPDWLVVEPPATGLVGVDEVHRVIRWLALHPVAAGRRAVLFRQADRLSGVAQNALLKALEEPPGGALLLLASALPDRLLPTVRSRCGERRLGEAAAGEEGGGGPSGSDSPEEAAGAPEEAWLDALLSPRPLDLWLLARDWSGLSREQLEARLGALEEALAASFRPRPAGAAEAGRLGRLRRLPAARRLAAGRSLARAAEAVRANVAQELALDVLFLELRELFRAAGAAGDVARPRRTRIRGAAPE
ncbi:MAG: hypothetical protein QJR08_04720 [Bacillota bacterium]|nr:hypothetical protein [Bacillota bacterium]